MELTAGIIAGHLQGEVKGDPDVIVKGVARIEQGKPGTACFLANPKYEKYLYDTKASVVLINRDFAPSAEVRATLVKVDDAYSAVAALLAMFTTQKKKKGWEFP
ncbi:MAG: LpxD N-terminal domain-containing protein, partial [Bacteroidales bacterium]|nr:LpxD N-terminal domain-containing protein [Bacteroidales bacterium]